MFDMKQFWDEYDLLKIEVLLESVTNEVKTC